MALKTLTSIPEFLKLLKVLTLNLPSCHQALLSRFVPFRSEVFLCEGRMLTGSVKMNWDEAQHRVVVRVSMGPGQFRSQDERVQSLFFCEDVVYECGTAMLYTSWSSYGWYKVVVSHKVKIFSCHLMCSVFQ